MSTFVPASFVVPLRVEQPTFVLRPLVTYFSRRDEFEADRQEEYLQKMQLSVAPVGIDFTWEYDDDHTIHARHVVTDTGWKILLDRGLDIYQRYEMNDAFALTNRQQAYRAVKAFEVTYLRDEAQQSNR